MALASEIRRFRRIVTGLNASGQFVILYAVTDDGETKLGVDDVLIERGTDHAWANRSENSCVVAIIMLKALLTET